MKSNTSNSEDRDMSEVTYDVNESFPILMTTCVKKMRERLNDLFAERGYSVTTEQWLILTFLADQDGVSQQDLAKKSNRSEVSVLNLVRKLELADLVTRRRDPDDGRCNRVYLTEQGRTLHQSLVPIAKANIVRMSAGVSAHEIELFKNILRKVTNNLKS